MVDIKPRSMRESLILSEIPVTNKTVKYTENILHDYLKSVLKKGDTIQRSKTCSGTQNVGTYHQGLSWLISMIIIKGNWLRDLSKTSHTLLHKRAVST